MSDWIWQTFDSLFKTIRNQGLRMEEMEARIAELERKLNAPAKDSALAPSASLTLVTTNAPESEPDGAP